MFWKTSCTYILCLVWQFSFPLWKWKFGSFERQVVIAPCFVCDMFSFPYHCESESLKALKVLKDKFWLQLVSSVTCRPFHTEMKVKIWMFWKTSCYYTLCIVKVFLSIPLWKWIVETFERQVATSFERQIVITLLVVCDWFSSSSHCEWKFESP